MTEFVKCPCCSGHESISADAAAALATIIEHRLNGSGESPVTTELWNIRNTILNTQERAVAIDSYTPPLCPTPKKRKYSNLAHATPDAMNWKQHVYACECGYWHLSKQSLTEHISKINSPAAGANEFEAIDPLLE